MEEAGKSGIELIWFNLNAEYRLDESQAGIKTARIKINNLRYADDTTPLVESKKEL